MGCPLGFRIAGRRSVFRLSAYQSLHSYRPTPTAKHNTTDKPKTTKHIAIYFTTNLRPN
jgi:hypothetical protein